MAEFDIRGFFFNLPGDNLTEQTERYLDIDDPYNRIKIPPSYPKTGDILELAASHYDSPALRNTGWSPRVRAYASVIQAAWHVLSSGSRAINLLGLRSVRTSSRETPHKVSEQLTVADIPQGSTFRLVYEQGTINEVRTHRIVVQHLMGTGKASRTVGGIHLTLFDGKPQNPTDEFKMQYIRSIEISHPDGPPQDNFQDYIPDHRENPFAETHRPAADRQLVATMARERRGTS